MSVLLTVSPQQLTRGTADLSGIVSKSQTAHARSLQRQGKAVSNWVNGERKGQRASLGIEKELEEGVHLLECDTGFEEWKAAGNGPRSLP